MVFDDDNVDSYSVVRNQMVLGKGTFFVLVGTFKVVPKKEIYELVLIKDVSYYEVVILDNGCRFYDAVLVVIYADAVVVAIMVMVIHYADFNTFGIFPFISKIGVDRIFNRNNVQAINNKLVGTKIFTSFKVKVHHHHIRPYIFITVSFLVTSNSSVVVCKRRVHLKDTALIKLNIKGINEEYFYINLNLANCSKSFPRTVHNSKDFVVQNRLFTFKA